ncbi:hypothetical protein AC481_01805 [miscellaneous Crenarchaeota group archaeon SMTZ-80]|nr:MAG: hypothetical protein AC481_01805 [miscellaneous Crenarchaeota group archaeon SMTZ-80]
MTPNKSLLLGLLIILISLSFTETTFGTINNEIQNEGKALYLTTFKIDDFIIIEKEFKEDFSYEFEYSISIAIKILECDLSRPGSILRIDLMNNDGNVKFSIRPTSDRGVLFYYPSYSLIAFKHENAWTFGSWTKFEVVVSENSSFFYINDNLIGQNSPEFPAIIDDIELGKLRFGKINKRQSTFEGFIDNISIGRDNKNIFNESFDLDLKEYQITKSDNAVVRIMDAESFTTLLINLDKRSIAIGDKLIITCFIKDSFENGLENKTIYLRYLYEKGINELEIGETTSDGSLIYTWEAPKEVSGNIEISCKFLGDENHSASESKHVELFIKQKETLLKSNHFFTIIIGSAFIFLIALLSKKHGINKTSSYIFIASSAIGFFFSLIMLVNTLELKYYLIYVQREITVEFLSSIIDKFILVISFIISIISIPLSNKYKAFPKKIILIYFTLFISFILFILKFEFLSIVLAFSASVALIIFSMVFANKFLSIDKYQALLGYLAVILSILLLVELGSIFGWIFNVFNPHVPFDGSLRWLFSRIETNMSYVLYPFTPILLIILLFSWLWTPILNNVEHKLMYRKFFPISENYINSNRFIKFLRWPILFLSVGFALFVSYYPYFYGSKPIGVDIAWYLEYLKAMNDWNSAYLVLTSFESASRWLYLLILFLLKISTGLPPEFIVRVGPAIPASFVAITTYALVKIGTENHTIALLSSFLAAFSINTTVGVFGGIFANWLALSWVILFFAVLLYTPVKGLKFSIPLAFILNFLILATHAWTWIFLIMILLTYLVLKLGLMIIRERNINLEKDCKTVLSIISANAIIIAIMFSIMSRSELVQLSSEILTTFNFQNSVESFSILIFTIRFYVGGFFGNPIIFLFGIIGAFMLKDLKNNFRILIVSYLLVASMISIFVGQFWQWRILYMVPFQILAALGYAHMVCLMRYIYADKKDSKYTLNFFLVTLILWLVLTQFNYTLRCMTSIIPT